MKSTVVCGYIGLGRRGGAVLKDCVSKMSDVKVKYLCDQSQSRMEESQRVLKENGGYVFASDHSIPNSVSFANMTEIARLAHELGRY